MLFGLYIWIINLQNKLKMTITQATLQITNILKTNINYYINNKFKETKESRFLRHKNS